MSEPSAPFVNYGEPLSMLDPSAHRPGRPILVMTKPSKSPLALDQESKI
jgi:hypothetical protein